ncbi:MAG: hypothetical protein QN149_13640 [Armatimonadota bacterium]|nr:hypothetical protein [Armatimonadota bacterium]
MAAARKRAAQKIDPELLRQLDEHAASAEPVEAVFTLKPALATRAAGAGETERTVRELLRRVQAQVGEAPADYNVFRNLSAFAVVAPARFVRELMAQDEIATATANRQPQSMVIPPRGKRPVTDQ